MARNLHAEYGRRLRETVLGRSDGDVEINLGERLGGGTIDVPLSEFRHHAMVVGATGEGKSRLLEHILMQFVNSRASALVFLDVGDTANALKRRCYELGLDDDLILLEPHAVHAHGAFVSMNPVRALGMPQRRAQQLTDVFQAVVGVDTWTQTPRLNKWVYNTNVGLVYAALSMVEAQHLLSPTTNAWRWRILDHIPLADVHDDWEWLAAAWAKDMRLFDEKTESSINRFRQYLHNENLRRMLGGTRKSVDWHRVVDERKIVIVDLADRENVLGPQESSLYGMQVLEDLCAALRQRPETERDACFVVIDELANFVCPAIAWMLNFGRKYGVRFLGAFQHIRQLIDVVKNDPRTYDALLANTRLRIVFGGGLSAEDADRFGNEVFGPFLDPMRVKQEVRTVRQLTELRMMEIRSYGHFTGRSLGRGVGSVEAVSEMESETEMESDTDMNSSTHGRSSGSSFGTVDSRATAHGSSWTLPALGTPANGDLGSITQSDSNVMSSASSSAFMDASMESESHGYAHTTGISRSRGRAITSGRSVSESETVGEGDAETVVFAPVNVPSEPFYETRDEYMPLEEQLYELVARMRRMKKRDAILSIRGEEPVLFRTAELPDPRVCYDEGLLLDREYYGRISIAYTVEEVEEEIREREKLFLSAPSPKTRRLRYDKTERARKPPQDLLGD